MAFTQITTSNLDNTITTKLAAAEAANAAVANIVSLAISSVQIANSTYAVIDDTAANTGGGYLVINGTGFTNQCVVIVGTTNATSTTFANTRQLRAQVPGLAAATYPLYVVDSVTGATAIKVNGLTYSSFPAWSTGSSLSNQISGTAFGVSLSANSDSSVTYANTTALPAGTTLAANGYFSGIVTIGAQTSYSFDVKATDIENQDVSRTFSLTVAVTPQGQLYSWGRALWNGYQPTGRLGLNNNIDKSSPTQVGSDATWSIISAGVDASAAIKSDGTLWTWGKNDNRSLGLNLGTSYAGWRSSPTQVGSSTIWSKVDMQDSTMAIKTDGTLWMWGDNSYGELGKNDRNYVDSPVQIGSNTTWSKISIGQGVSASIKTDGTLWVWGLNSSGQLGQNDRINRSSPVQIGTDTTWNNIFMNNSVLFATKTDGTLWSCGNNFRGQLGVNDRVDRSSPVQIGSSTGWNKIAQQAGPVLAIKTDGTLWAWGVNEWGSLGFNNTGYRSSPAQVGTETNWKNIKVNYSTTIATKTDGTLWTWGRSVHGLLGANDSSTNTNSRSSPTQVGTSTNWNDVTINQEHVLVTTSS